MLRAATTAPRGGAGQRRSAVCSSRCAASTTGAETQEAKQRLLFVAAPLDRGSAARPSDRGAVEDAVAALEASCSPPEDVTELLSGTWRLLYSSTFAVAGPPGAGTPLRLGAVQQRIQPARQRLDNIVELSVSLPFVAPVCVSATLRHSLELEGRTARIAFTELTLRPPRGLRGARPVSLPGPAALAPGLDVLPGMRQAVEQAVVQAARAGTFDTTFVDGQLRVSRGALGELRVFVRD